ncbi:MAG TPA: YkvA family protein [Candidatus Methylomirabilis sp.]|nr:YkvA family protein [Candidatus Methylomirabilis sp.]
MSLLAGWKQWARQVKREVFALYLAYKDPRTPWHAKLIAGCVVAYAFSPIDLIPDFVPVLGYLDDLVIVPLGLLAARKLIPPLVLSECRTRAQARMERQTPTNWVAARVIIAIWLALAALGVWLLTRYLRG